MTVKQKSWRLQTQVLCYFLQECGVVNRVTILTDKFGGAKGYAYIEFEKADAAVSAVLLDGTELRNRNIKVGLHSNIIQVASSSPACWASPSQPACFVAHLWQCHSVAALLPGFSASF